MNQKIEFGKPFGPSKIAQSEIKEGSEVLISYGGGMGGSCKRIYTYDKVNLRDGEIITIKDICGVEHQLNSRFIVEILPKQLVSIDVKNLGNRNIGPAPVGGIDRYIYAISVKDKAIISNKDIYSDSLRDYLVVCYEVEA